MGTGVCGIWAMKAGDYVSTEFDGSSAGLATAITYCGGNGVIQVYPGGSSIPIPSLTAGIVCLVYEAGGVTVYGAQASFTRGGLRREQIRAVDYANVQNAVDALDPVYGGEVLLPPTLLDSTTTPAFTGVTLADSRVLVGAPGGGSVLKQTNANLDAVTINRSYAGLRDVQIRGANSAGSGRGVLVTFGTSNTQYYSLKNVIITQTPSWGLYIDPTSGGHVCSHGHYENVNIDQNVATNVGSVFLGGGDNHVFSACQFNGKNTTGTYSAFGGATIEQGTVHLEGSTAVVFDRQCRWEEDGAGACLSIKAVCWEVVLNNVYFEKSATGTRAHLITCAGGVNALVVDTAYINSHSTSVGPRIFKTTSNSDVKGGVFRNIVGISQISTLQTDDLSLGNALDEVEVTNCKLYYPNLGAPSFNPLSVTGAGAILGPTVASATTVTLPNSGEDLFFVSGTTTITSITASRPKRRIVLVFTGTASGTGLTDGSNLKLNTNFVYTPDDTITLLSDGTNWIELSRSPN